MKLIKLSLLAAAALTAMAACGDDSSDGDGTPTPGSSGSGGPGGGTESSVSLVTPNRGLLDRELEVQIGGSATKFDANAKPDFGEGIEVLEVNQASPTLLIAKLKIAPTAPLGPRKVTIGKLTAEGAFSVTPAIEVTGGKVAQGNLVELTIDNNDAKAFDTQAFKLEAAGLIDLGSQATGPQTATGFLLAAPLAKTGKSQVKVQNLGADGKARLTFLSAPDALEVTARQATAFEPGAAKDVTFAGGNETQLFKLSTAASQSAIVDYRVQVEEGGDARPVAFLFGTTGTADSRLGQALPPQNPFTGEFDPPPYDLHVAVPLAGTAAVDHYVVLADIGTAKGANAKITASRTAAKAANEAGQAHGPDAPQALGAITAEGGQLVSAELKGDKEVDVYKFSVAPGAKIQVVATSDPDLEVVVTKDPNVLEDPQDTPDAQRKVLGYLYSGKQFAAQATTRTAVGAGEIYAVVQFDAAQGAVKTGKYTVGARAIP